MISPDLEARFRERYSDSPEHMDLLEHALSWNETLQSTPPGWAPSSASAYRMALEFALHLLLGGVYQEDQDAD